MRQIRMSGTKREELIKSIEFILNNPEYTINDWSKRKITNIEIKNKCLYAYSYGDNKHFQDRPGRLPIPLTVEAFCLMAADWWENEAPYEADSCFDGTIKKGFLTTAGKNWGSIHRDDGGSDASYTDKDPEAIECDNLHDIIIAVNRQYYGK